MDNDLLPYERRSLETLERDFGVEGEIIAGFAQSLKTLRGICERLLNEGRKEFRGGRLAVIGLARHSHQLLAGGLRALEAGNELVWSNCVLSLVEAFGACVMISEQPEAITSLLEVESSEEFLKAAARAETELMPDISRLQRVVRPGPESAYAGFQSVDDKGWYANFECGLCRPKPTDGRKALVVLANLAYYLTMKLEAVANDEKALSAGEVVMVRSNEKQ